MDSHQVHLVDVKKGLPPDQAKMIWLIEPTRYSQSVGKHLFKEWKCDFVLVVSIDKQRIWRTRAGRHSTVLTCSTSTAVRKGLPQSVINFTTSGC